MVKLCSIEGCERVVSSRGWCEAHYKRWQIYGDPFPGRPLRTPNGEALRYLDVVLAYEGVDCLIWPYNRSNHGYAQVWRNRRMKLVPGLVCTAIHGPPPSPKHEVAHSCGNGKLGCVAPGHLRWATSKENKADMLKHGTRLLGERTNSSKLTALQVREIRRELAAGRTHAPIAADYGVSPQTIDRIALGKIWGWLDG